MHQLGNTLRIAILAVIAFHGHEVKGQVGGVLEVALYSTQDLAKEFYTKFQLERNADREEYFKANLVVQYLEGINSVYSDQTLRAKGIHLRIEITDVYVIPDTGFRNLYDMCTTQANETGNRDAALFIVKRDGPLHKRLGFSAGQGMTNTACSPNTHCAVVAETANLDTANARLAAHELGHVLGLVDQGYQLSRVLRRRPHLEGTGRYADTRCRSTSIKGVMAGNAATWTVCSQDALLDLLPKHTCLRNEPDTTPPVDGNKLLGVVFPSRKDQCDLRMELDDPPYYKVNYNSAKNDGSSPCTFAKYECTKDEPTSMYPWRWRDFSGVKLMVGTPCGTEKVCFFSQCVSKADLGDLFSPGAPGGGDAIDPPSTGGCDESWVKYKGVCYKQYGRGQTPVYQDEAESYCETEGATLVTINSKEVNQFITATFHTGQRRSWIGLHMKEGQWVWFDGTPLTYNHWMINSPRAGQQCASMGSSHSPEFWFSKDCNKPAHRSAYWICSKRA